MDASNSQPATVCVQPNTMDVVVLQGLGGKEIFVRPRTGKFHGTYVAIELALGYLGKDAIVGKMTTMQPFDSAKLEAAPSAAAASEPSVARVSGGVIKGRRIKFTEPAYPMMAKVGHVSGSVVLSAIIGVDGSVLRLLPIASTDPMFTDEAAQAVKQWKYSPYLLNGVPTAVDTTITVNFQIN